MLEFEIVARGLYSSEQVCVHYDPTLQMPRDQQLQNWMDTLWQERLQQAQQRGKRLFNAPLFRFCAAMPHPDGTLHITVGNTSYKEYVTTRIPDFAHSHTRAELGNALSVCSVIETSDNFILLDKRQGVDVYEGRYHVIGGFFERERDERVSTDTISSALPDPFAAMRREIREETGVQSADIASQHCLAVVYDLATPHAELCFLTRLHIPLSEVLTRTPEDDEIKQLQSLSVTERNLRDFVISNHGNISATGEPNLLLYGAHKFGEAWYTNIVRNLQLH